MSRSLRDLFDAVRELDATRFDAARRELVGGSQDQDSPIAALAEALEGLYLRPRTSREHELVGRPIDAIAAAVRPGISLVTCCRNREANLLRAIRSWLDIPEIDEIIVVDWSSDVPVHRTLSKHGLMTPRVRVLRVEGQPRWILSYAFNCGFRIARFNAILKTDADILVQPDFFERNVLGESAFFAGNWRTASKGQEHINGFFFVRRDDLMRVKGFNEHIITYGWDDDDLYARLVASGLGRRDIDPGSLYHIPHGDQERLGCASQAGSRTLAAQLDADPAHKIRVNKVIAETMPEWNSDRRFLDVKIEEVAGNVVYARQSAASWHLTPPHIEAIARYSATIQLLSWSLGPGVHWISPEKLDVIVHNISREELNRTWIELFQRVDPGELLRMDRIVVIDLNGTLSDESDETMDVYRALDELAGLHDRLVYLHRPFPSGASPLWRFKSLRFIGTGLQLADGLPEDWSRLRWVLEAGPEATVAQGRITVLRGHVAQLVEAVVPRRALAAPAGHVAKPYLVVDAQHGLGNRLRALASGLAVAEATGRRFALVWTPDCHCEAEFSDLFDDQLEVVRTADDLPPRLYRRFNYMEIEPGATKDEPIDTASPEDIVVRSAYVLKHPASVWAAENAMLRQLTVSRPVRELVASVADGHRIGLHVRSVGTAGDDHRPYDAAANWSAESHEQLNFWRSRSGADAFIRVLNDSAFLDSGEPFFLASDAESVYSRFVDEFGPDRVRFLRRELFDRSARQIVCGLADAILLSRSRVLLGSNWSSFSELAARLACGPIEMKLAGVDF